MATDLGEAIACKLGTIPFVIYARDKRTPLEVGRMVRVKVSRGGQWQNVLVTRVDPSGYFMADLM